MGLDTTHNCWNGSYSSFMLWREEIARCAGLPPLRSMAGFCDSVDSSGTLPIKWEILKPNPLHALLNHSDCDGIIPSASCAKIADELEKLLPVWSGDALGRIWSAKTRQFINGLRVAAKSGEDVMFG